MIKLTYPRRDEKYHQWQIKRNQCQLRTFQAFQFLLWSKYSQYFKLILCAYTCAGIVHGILSGALCINCKNIVHVTLKYVSEKDKQIPRNSFRHLKILITENFSVLENSTFCMSHDKISILLLKLLSSFFFKLILISDYPGCSEKVS